MTEKTDKDKPVSSQQSMAELRRMMGDSNANGVVSGKELLRALQNHNHFELMDGVAVKLMTDPLIAFDKSRREITDPEQLKTFDKVERKKLQAHIDTLWSELSSRLPPNYHETVPEKVATQFDAMASIRRIKIPKDMEALALAVLGDGSTVIREAALHEPIAPTLGKKPGGNERA